MITLHAEVNSDGNILEIHDVIDNIEVELAQKLNCMATIHMDPIAINDEKVTMLRMMVSERMTQLFGENVSIHDFRVVEGPTHTNVIFDIVVPFGFEHSDTKVSEMVKHNISEIEEIDYRAVIKVEHAYI